MKSDSQRRLGMVWLAIVTVVIVLFFDIRTALYQHRYYQNELRRSDSRVLAQALKSLFRDSPDVANDWDQVFIVGSGSGQLYCSALRQQLPVNTISAVLAPYLRVLPQDPDRNLSQASLYYLRSRGNHWFVGSCVLETDDEILVS